MVNEDTEQAVGVLIELTEANLKLMQEKHDAFAKNITQNQTRLGITITAQIRESVNEALDEKLSDFKKGAATIENAAQGAIKAQSRALMGVGVTGVLAAITIALAGALCWLWLDNQQQNEQISKLGAALLQNTMPGALITVCGKEKKPCIAVQEVEYKGKDGTRYRVPLNY